MRDCVLMPAVGASGVVFSAVPLSGKAKARGARVVEINPIATDLSYKADLVWRTTVGEGSSRLLSELAVE